MPTQVEAEQDLELLLPSPAQPFLLSFLAHCTNCLPDSPPSPPKPQEELVGLPVITAYLICGF